MKQIYLVFILALLIGITSTLFVVTALYQSTVQIHSAAAIKTVGVSVYWDPGFTEPIANIDWGIIEPGETKNVSCYIVNTSNVPVILTLTTGNWQPTNTEQYMNLSWNYDEHAIPVSDYTPVTFSLHVDAATTGIAAFSFDITITGSG